MDTQSIQYTKNYLDSFRLWTALITPFDAHGNIDFVSLGGLIKRQAAANNGIVLLGSTGEGANISLNDRKKIVEYAASLAIKTPLLVGVWGVLIEETLDWVRYCNSLAIDGFLMVTPVYAKPGPIGQRNWFQALLDAAAKPCMLYNIPSRAATALSPYAVESLIDNSKLWAVKESSGDLKTFSQWQKNYPSIGWFSGDDALFADQVELTAAGLVSVFSNVWPEAVSRYVSLSLAGQSQAHKDVFNKAANSMFIASNPVPVKALLFHKGLISSQFCRPPMSDEDCCDIQPLIEADEAMNQWLQDQSSDVE